jgi:hypothetical protein
VPEKRSLEMKHKGVWELLKIYPSMRHPMYCENGCGAVIELAEALRSYKRDDQGNPMLICQCCAAEEGHLDEDIEEPEETPVCNRPEKKRLR